jgi:hypothetical protein
MGKRLFWIFMLAMLVTSTIAVIYIQSESFANFAKEKIRSRVQKDLGLEMNFDRLKIGILPPSVSLMNVDVKVLSRANPLELSTDTVFRVGRMGFSFRMIQAFSRGLSINKVFLSDAEVKLMLPKPKASAPETKLSDLVHKPIRIDMGDDFFLAIRQLELRNTTLQLHWLESDGMAGLAIEKITYLALTPSPEGTNIVANLESAALDTAKVKERFQAFKLNADIARNVVQLTTLDLQRREAALHASGRLVGSIDNLPQIRPDVDLILRAPIRELKDFETSLGSLSGELLADLKLVGKMNEPAVQGRIEVTQFQHSSWNVDKIEATGTYGTGLLVLDSLNVAAGGGRVSLKNKLELPIPFRPEPKAFQLRFDGVKFQDFAGDIKKSVNNLKMQLDGSLDLRLDFTNESKNAKLHSVTMRPSITVRDLELNNQAYGKNRPYKTIFKLTPFQLRGAVNWRQGDLKVTEATAEFPSGKLAIQGSVSGAQGFNLSGVSEAIDMGREVGAISDIPLTGRGAVTVTAKGPADAVRISFGLNMRDAR